jgi:predicted ABC-type ATPase
VQVLDPTLDLSQVLSVVSLVNSNFSKKLSKNEKEAFLRFNSRHIAERVRATLEREFSNRVAVVWADKDNLLIALHLSFNKETANLASSQFTKERVEAFFSQNGQYKCME